MTPLILVVEDEIKIAELCRDYLQAAGYIVRLAHTGPAGLQQARLDRPDLIVLDLMLPGIDGLDVCRQLRHDSNVPIIMLTARVEEADRLIGLELGADDYVTKPFSPRELVARVRAVLRRAEPGYTNEVLRAGALLLDRARYEVAAGDHTITLTPTEFEILATLAAAPGRIFSRAQLLRAARGVAFESYERAIDSHIRNLRRKLETLGPAAAESIVTVHGVGYKLAP